MAKWIAVFGLTTMLVVPAGAAAQSQGPSPTPLRVERDLCITVQQPEGALTPELLTQGILDGSIVITSVDVACDAETAPEETAPVADFVPLGEAGRFDSWSAVISKVNDNGWKAVKAENEFNDAPPKGSRIVLVTFKLKNESEDEALDPSFNVEGALYSKSSGDGFDAYDGVTPGNGIYGDEIPPGRNRSITLAYVVPKTVGRDDLSLYLSGGSEYVEMDLAPAR